MSNFDYFDEPIAPNSDPDDNNTDDVPLTANFNSTLSTDSYDANTPINTMTYYDEPDPNANSNSFHQSESSASPPPPNSNIIQESKPVDPILEDEEMDRYNENNDDDDDEDDDEDDDDEETDIKNLENELETIRNKLEAIKVENMLFSKEMSESAEQTSLTIEYDEKIMFYDEEYHKQQQIIDEEEKLIKEYQEEFDKKIKQYNIDDEMLKNSNSNEINGILRNNNNNTMHQPKSSIVLYDNSFAINHQLQQEIDKLTNQIDWLQISKIQLVKNTAAEVDRLRAIIKKLQT